MDRLDIEYALKIVKTGDYDGREVWVSRVLASELLRLRLIIKEAFNDSCQHEKI
jgi:hypothetical protein